MDRNSKSQLLVASMIEEVIEKLKACKNEQEWLEIEKQYKHEEWWYPQVVVPAIKVSTRIRNEWPV